MVRELGLLQANKTKKWPFSVQKGVQLAYPPIKLFSNAKHASIGKGSKGRAQQEEAREKKIDQKEQKRLLLLGIELHHLQMRSIYGVYAV